MKAGTIILSYEDPTGNVWALLVRDHPLTRTWTSDLTRWYKQKNDYDTTFVVGPKLLQFKFPGGKINDNELEHYHNLVKNRQFANLVQWANTPDKKTNLSGALRELQEEANITIEKLTMGEGAFLKYQTTEVVPDTDKPTEDVELHVFHWHLGRINQTQIDILARITGVGHDVCAAIWYPVSCIYSYDKRVEQIYSLVPQEVPEEGRVYRLTNPLQGLQHAYDSDVCILSQMDRFFPIDPLNAKWLKQAGMLQSCKSYLSNDILSEKEFERLEERGIEANISEEYETQRALHVPTGNQYTLRFIKNGSTADRSQIRIFTRNQYLAATLYLLHGIHDLPRLKLVSTVKDKGYIIATPQGERSPARITQLTDQNLIKLIVGIDPKNLRRVKDEDRRKCFLDCPAIDPAEGEKLAADLNQRIAAILNKSPQLSASSHMPISDPHLKPSSEAPVPQRDHIVDELQFIKDLMARDAKFKATFNAIAGRSATFEERYKRYRQLHAAILTMNAHSFGEIENANAQYAADLKWSKGIIATANLMEHDVLNPLKAYLANQIALLSGTYVHNSIETDNRKHDLKTCPLKYLYSVLKKEAFIYFLQNLSPEEKRDYVKIIEDLLIELSLQFKQLKEDHDWSIKRSNQNVKTNPDGSRTVELSERELAIKLLAIGRLINFLNIQGSLLAGTHVKDGKTLDIQKCSNEYLHSLFTQADVIRQLRFLSPEGLQKYLELNKAFFDRMSELYAYLINTKSLANEIATCIDDACNLDQIIKLLTPRITAIRTSTDPNMAELKTQLEAYYHPVDPKPPVVPSPPKLSALPVDKKYSRSSGYIEQAFLPRLPGLAFEALSEGNNSLIKAVSVFLNESEMVLREKVILYLQSFPAAITAADGSSTEEYIQKVRNGQDVDVGILSSSLGRSIIVVDSNINASNFTSVNQLHGDPIFVYNSEKGYDAFIRQDEYFSPSALKELFADTPPPPVPVRDDVGPTHIPQSKKPPVPIVLPSEPPIKNPSLPPIKPPPPVPPIKPVAMPPVPTGLLKPPVPVMPPPPAPPVKSAPIKPAPMPPMPVMSFTDLLIASKRNIDAKIDAKNEQQKLRHIIFPINIGTETNCHWILLQFVASKIDLPKATAANDNKQFMADIGKQVTKIRLAVQGKDIDNYDPQHINFLLENTFKNYEQVLLMSARSKTDFLKITSSNDLLKTNSDAHSSSPLSFTYFDSESKKIDEQIGEKLRKLGIGIGVHQFTPPKDKNPENTGLWIIEVAKALVHGSELNNIDVDIVQSANVAALEKGGLTTLPQGREQDHNPDWDEPAPKPAYTAAFHKPAPAVAPVALKPAAASDEVPNKREEKALTLQHP